MKKIAMLLVLCSFLFAGAGMAAAAPTFAVNHRSYTFLVDDKPAYDNSNFHQIFLGVFDERALTESDKTHTGTLTIQKGTYSYYDKADKLVDINEQDKTFDLKLRYYDDTVVEFLPKAEDVFVSFLKSADSGLNGKAYSWSALGSTGSGTIHNFRTTQAQLTSYVPYAEITASGIAFRMVKASDPSKAIGVPFNCSYRLNAYDIDGNSILTTKKIEYKANEVVSDTFSLSPEALKKVSSIFIQAAIYENPANPDSYCMYVWDFWRTVKTNEGVANESALVPLKLKAGEQATFSVVLKPDYFGLRDTQDIKKPLFISNNSLVATSWTYDKNTRTYSVTVKGMKGGTTDLSIYYQKKYSDDGTTIDYRTLPIQVTVEGSTGGSSGGCDAGFGLLALARAGAALLRKKK